MTRISPHPTVIQSSGVYDLPSWTTEQVGDGFEITVGQGLVAFCLTQEHNTRPILMQVPEKTFELPHNQVSIIFAHWSQELGPHYELSPFNMPHDDIDHMLAIPVLQCYSYTPLGVSTPLLSVIDFDEPAKRPIEKILRRISETERIKVGEYQFTVGEAPTRVITVAEGTAYVEVNRIEHAAVRSDVGITYNVYFNAGQVIHDPVTQYNNTVYSSGSGLIAVNPNQYCINWVFRSVRQNTSVILNLLHTRTGILTLQQATEEPFPTQIPDSLRLATTFVGRIIVQQGASTAALVTQWWDIAH